GASANGAGPQLPPVSANGCAGPVLPSMRSSASPWFSSVTVRSPDPSTGPLPNSRLSADNAATAATPVPCSITWMVAPSLSVTSTVWLAGPITVGEKLYSSVQLSPAANATGTAAPLRPAAVNGAETAEIVATSIVTAPALVTSADRLPTAARPASTGP